MNIGDKINASSNDLSFNIDFTSKETANLGLHIKVVMQVSWKY